jgi:hypothetical protein
LTFLVYRLTFIVIAPASSYCLEPVSAITDNEKPETLNQELFCWHNDCRFPLNIFMIRKLKSGEYRIYSRKKDPKTNKRRNLGTFGSLRAAKKHEKEIQYFKHH